MVVRRICLWLKVLVMDRVHKGVGNDVYRKEKDGLNIWDSRAYSSARCFSLVLA